MQKKSKENYPKYVKKPRSQFLKVDSAEGWDEEIIIQMILLLNESNKKFSLSSMGLNKSPTPDAVISSFLGRDCSLKFLYHTTCLHFGSWNSALRECNIQIIKSPTNKFWTSKLIIKCIKALHAENHSLTVTAIWRDRSLKTTNILLKISGRKTTGSALHDAARRNIGSWDKALQQAGIEVDEVKEKPFWTKSKIISAIHVLSKAGIPLNSKSISRNINKRTKNVIKQKIGKARTGRSLYGGAYRAFGSWDRALNEAGLCIEDIRKAEFFWNKRSIKRVLNILNELNIPVNSGSLRRDTSDQTKEIIYNYTGQMEFGTKIYRLGFKLIGSWNDVLKHSGFKLSHIRRCGVPCKKDHDQIIKYIRLLNINEFHLNYSAINQQTDLMKLLIEDHYGIPISGKSLLKAAYNLKRFTNQWLTTSRLNAQNIHLNMRVSAIGKEARMAKIFGV